MLKNLNILYDNLLKKSKETDKKLEKYERIKDKNAFIINSIEMTNTQNEQTQINKIQMIIQEIKYILHLINILLLKKFLLIIFFVYIYMNLVFLFKIL